ncbi:hypothetical protein SAPIO_CDS9296 [Scedosporium apiospermum]|uniref:GED domain-containing protein n=1 Tax=Pseudallescheria apiosperma TaxID=563466 RepID=A0A084FYS2_PSEDA|nr:uncharacterized protein SAPIO_CDS9296 [Scedosporium apiospermum]KEZ40234.1 hypothetical protein SAPIO_CDS9296 [Scedosporium apiospermum]
MSLASADMKREIHAKPEYGRKYVRYLKNVLRKDGNDGSYFALEKTIDNMIVYYDHHLKHFTENVIILAAEKQLIRDIPKILDWKLHFSRMDDASIKALAGEPPEIPRKRERLEGEKTSGSHMRSRSATNDFVNGVKMREVEEDL